MARLSRVRAAGGVLWREGRRGPEVLLVHRPSADDWTFPKGKTEHGENELDTAVREVGEETGLRFALGARLGTCSYRVDGRPKTVTYWSMRLDPSHGSDPAAADPGEIDGYAWLEVAEARARLTYPSDGRMLQAFGASVGAQVSLILVRHATAGKRSEWTGDDAARPLDERGHAQAAAIARSIPAFGPSELVSAPLTRCVQTAEPLARGSGLAVRLSGLVADAALEDDAATALAQVRAWATGERTVVAISQGDLISAALEDLLGPAANPHPRKKGSAWVFTARDGAVVTADYYRSLLPPPPG